MGWIAGGPAPGRRIATALVTAVRANALALAIARASFPNDGSTVVAVVVFGLVSITVPVVTALVVGRRPGPEAVLEGGHEG
jgi:hypothetical protein